MGAGMVHLPRVVSGRPEEVLAPVGSSRRVLERLVGRRCPGLPREP